MTTFFQQTAQAMIAKHIDRFPLLKLDQVIDWQPIEQYLNRDLCKIPFPNSRNLNKDFRLFGKGILQRSQAV